MLVSQYNLWECYSAVLRLNEMTYGLKRVGSCSMESQSYNKVEHSSAAVELILYAKGLEAASHFTSFAVV